MNMDQELMKSWDSFVLAKLQQHPEKAMEIIPTLGFFRKITEEFLPSIKNTLERTSAGREELRPSVFSRTPRRHDKPIPYRRNQRAPPRLTIRHQNQPPEKPHNVENDILALESPKWPSPKRAVYNSIVVGNAIDKYFYRKGLANPSFLACNNTSEALIEISNHIPHEQYGLAVLAFENSTDFDHNSNKALEALTRMSHVCKAVGPQNMDTKNMKVDMEEVEVDAGEADLKKIGLKMIKEAAKEGYPVTNKMTKKKLFS
jgi:hypothetical protein